jgi:competence ComEA-like helix-hairpin-helix protein
MVAPASGSFLPNMTRMESNGLLTGGGLLLLLALVRVGFEALPNRQILIPGEESRLEALMGQSQELKEDAAARSRPLRPGERLDPNRATEADLDRLPGVGPATAWAMASNRDQHGGFRRAEDLLRVPGIGPAKLERMAPYLDFSAGVPLELSRRTSVAGGPGRSSKGRDSPAGSSSSVGTGLPEKPGSGAGVLDVNRASAEELQELPGIGPALAARILESRKMEGPFRVPEDLLRVKGIGEAKLARVMGLIGFGG